MQHILPKVYTFTSNNQLLDDTTAKTSISFTPKEDGKLYFNWNVKSETDYDKLTIKLNDIVLVNKKSGMNVSGNIENDDYYFEKSETVVNNK